MRCLPLVKALDEEHAIGHVLMLGRVQGGEVDGTSVLVQCRERRGYAQIIDLHIVWLAFHDTELLFINSQTPDESILAQHDESDVVGFTHQ